MKTPLNFLLDETAKHFANIGEAKPHCFECSETKGLKKDQGELWCEKHYKERNEIIFDFINHATYGN